MNLTAWRLRPSNVFYGWWIVAASAGVGILSGGIFFHGFNALFLPLQESLGLSNARTALVFSLSRAEGSMEGPIAGRLIDRFGSRWLVMVGVAMAGIGYLALSQVNGFWGFALIYLGVISLGCSVAFQHALFATLNMWFIRRRARVMTFFSASFALGGAVVLPLMTMIILRTSWQTGVVAGGTVFLAFILPLTLIVRPSPESMGLLPDGDSPRQVAPTSEGGNQRGAGSGSSQDPDFTVRRAMGTSSFWLLALGTCARQIARAGIVVNLMPILVWKGAEQQTAANLIGMLLAANITAQMAIGWLADRWPKQVILAPGMALECLALIVLLLGSGSLAVYTYIIMAGLADGVSVISWATLGDYFGRRNFASIRGVITFSYSWAIIGAPVFAGWVFDHYQSYEITLLIALALFGVATLCYATMRRPG